MCSPARSAWAATVSAGLTAADEAKERGIDDVEIVVVEGLAEGVERRVGRVVAEAHCAALVRRSVLRERLGQHDGEARRTQHPSRLGDQRLVRGEVRPPPIEDDGPVTAHPHPALGMRQVLGHGVPVDAVSGEPGAHRARHGTNLGAQHRLHDLAQKLQVAQRRAALAVAEIEVVERQRLLKRFPVGPERPYRHHRRAVVVHVVAPDHSGRIGEAARVLRVDGAKQDRSTVDGARSQYEEIAPDLRAVGQLGGLDAPAARIGEQANNKGLRSQCDVPVLQHRVDEARLGVALGTQAAGETVAGVAAYARAARMVLHGRRNRERAQALGAQSLGDLGDRRIVSERRIRVGARARRLRRVGAGLAMYAEEAFGAGVVGLERVVLDGPRRRQSTGVLHGAEILAPEAEHRGTKHLRMAADIVELPRPKRAAASVGPTLVGLVGGIGVDRLGVPVAVFARHPPPAFQDHDARAGGGQDVGDTATAHTGPDDDDIDTAGHRLRVSFRFRGRRAPPWTCRR